MLQQEAIIKKARELGFADIGFTTADPFEEHRRMLLERQEEYGWAEMVGLDPAHRRGGGPGIYAGHAQSGQVYGPTCSTCHPPTSGAGR